VGGVANPASRLILAILVVMDDDLDQEHHDAAGNGQRQSSSEIVSEFGGMPHAFKLQYSLYSKYSQLNFVLRRGCSFKGARVSPVVQNQVQEEHQDQNAAKGHHNRRAGRGIDLNTL
jgi:hypothetical protein